MRLPALCLPALLAGSLLLAAGSGRGAVEPALDGPYISEFLAANPGPLADEDGDLADWIELHNPTGEEIDLADWFLTDDPQDLRKSRLPALILAAGEHRVVFASGKGPGLFRPEIHTGFALDIDGEYLALVKPDGKTIVHAFDEYPEQRPGASYGYEVTEESLQAGYFETPTPGFPNRRRLEGRVDPTPLRLG